MAASVELVHQRGEGSAKLLAARSTAEGRAMLPLERARTLLVLPLERMEGSSRLVAVANSVAHDPELRAVLAFAFGGEVRLSTVDDRLLRDAIALAYCGSDDLLQDAAERLAVSEHVRSQQCTQQRVDGDVPKFLDTLIQYAIVHGASDLHLIPVAEGSVVRLRIDGRLRTHSARIGGRSSHEQLVSRIKVLARLDITRRAIGQDGAFCFSLEGEHHIRVSLIPTVHGEKVVLRFLGAGDVVRFDQLGFSCFAVEMIERALSLGEGLIVLAGATGSGKTTTLYGLMQYLAGRALSLTSIEDPVERVIADVAQTSIDESAGLTYAAALRALMRQDPDVILIGEIRDQASAAAAVRAAMTGHLILTTVHARSGEEVISRLLELGIDPLSISQTLSMTITQRLLPRLCSHCKVFDLSASRTLGVSVYREVGCPRCDHIGHSGQVLAAEIASAAAICRDSVVGGQRMGAMPPLSKLVTLTQSLELLVRSGQVSAQMLWQEQGFTGGEKGIINKPMNDSSSQPPIGEPPYRENVCMLLINSAGEVLLGERRGEPGVWQLPQGGVEPGLSLEENVLKELHEELGLASDKVQILKRLEATHKYDFSQPLRYGSQLFRGQNQSFWLVRFLGVDGDIVLDLHSPEFGAWSWCRLDEVAHRAEAKRVAGYRAPVAEVMSYLARPE